MGQSCSTDTNQANASVTSGKSDAASPQATQFSYQLPSIRRPKHPSPRTASRDPADYASSGLSSGTFVRLPGEINDQRINIDSADNSSFLLLDNCDSVQVDDCRKCTFFIGPTIGSVFLRGCTDCTFIVICGQLRLRDVKDSKLSLFCRSRPVIEASSNIGIGAFAAPQYLALRMQAARASISTLANLCYNVHDFTPAEGNWHTLDFETTRALLPSLKSVDPSSIDLAAEEEPPAYVVPYLHPPVLPSSAEASRVVTVVGKPGMFEAFESLLLGIGDMTTQTLGTGAKVVESAEVKVKEAMMSSLLAAAPSVRSVIKPGFVVPVFLVLVPPPEGGDAALALKRLQTDPSVAVALPASNGGTALRDALLAGLGTDSGFGQAF